MMESNKIAIAALLFIVLIVGLNFVMYFYVRSWTSKGKSRWMGALKDSLSKPMDSSANKSMEELRKQIAELKNKESKKE